FYSEHPKHSARSLSPSAHRRRRHLRTHAKGLHHPLTPQAGPTPRNPLRASPRHRTHPAQTPHPAPRPPHICNFFMYLPGACHMSAYYCLLSSSRPRKPENYLCAIWASSKASPTTPSSASARTTTAFSGSAPTTDSIATTVTASRSSTTSS